MGRTVSTNTSTLINPHPKESLMISRKTRSGILHSALLLLVTCSLASCNRILTDTDPVTAPVTPPDPKYLVLNGLRIAYDDQNNPTGSVNMGISAYDRKKVLMQSAVIKSVVVKIYGVDVKSGAVIRSLQPLPFALEDQSVDLDAEFATTSTARVVTALPKVVPGVCGQVENKGPLNAMLMLDTTGSMTSTDPNSVRVTAAKDFVKKLRPDDAAAVAHFDTSSTTIQNITPGLLAAEVIEDFQKDKAVLSIAIEGTGNDQKFFGGGGTNIYDATYDAVTLTKVQSVNNKIAIILTDGDDNASKKTVAEVASYANKNGVTLYTLGLGNNNPALSALANQTGGLFSFAQSASQLNDLLVGIYNSTIAQGCVSMAFEPKPASGTTIRGKVQVIFESGAKPSQAFSITF